VCQNFDTRLLPASIPTYRPYFFGKVPNFVNAPTFLPKCNWRFLHSSHCFLVINSRPKSSDIIRQGPKLYSELRGLRSANSVAILAHQTSEQCESKGSVQAENSQRFSVISNCNTSEHCNRNPLVTLSSVDAIHTSRINRAEGCASKRSAMIGRELHNFLSSKIVQINSMDNLKLIDFSPL